ncbi:hypothetical protein TanjilG_15318 [Lupinus angustifolius]|uniref:B box-type domain-containing protein n=1 Tax=Lupinus angustifolius TaxID=3871 RepID=A0A1J7HGY6_LUPAN|nr:PREDICTED: uncharacterized protein LOC109347157 [Lupinus angustifolius]OIW12078.1 hypothetical protein TanjilG_15318 [Lupinus angustifolius]
MKKKCELCNFPATTFCDSDQATLCWNCDSKVHTANFLVARHTRTLLCHTCHSLTPWKASGATTGNAVSLCVGCAGGTRIHGDEGEESEGDNGDELERLEEDGDNQVVPWSSTATAPPDCKLFGSEGSVTRCGYGDEDVSESAVIVSVKRRRQDHDIQEGSKRRNEYAGNRRDQVDYSGEPQLKVSPATAMDILSGSRGYCDSRESEDR